ncbi:MAG: AmmeMemoRadiSam system protein A [Planctomycetes bacterium]|nr:AmmeMemoRadiSam system protein A [Planctomycetota bacterium]
MTISAEERTMLVDLARKAVESAVTSKPRPQLLNPSGMLAEPRGCFVTLTNDGDLRGCIGTFYPQGPLGLMIIEMGREAARDPRFVMNPITPKELPNLTVEVSVLSPLEPTDEPEKLQPGVHGIYIIRGGRGGCFLPEVATDQGWNAVEFLSYCCAHKAGLPADAWKQPDTKVFLFTSEKFDR